MTKIKVLTVHVEKNDLPVVLEKVEQLNSKSGPFDCAIILGDVASQLNLMTISPKLPPIFVTGNEDCKNISNKEGLVILRNRIYTFKNGLKIAYFTVMDRKQFSRFDNFVDVLVTRDWSIAVNRNNLKIPENSQIDDIVNLTHPRYHFTYGDGTEFFELEPFVWRDDRRMTRFINLAAYGSKRKWAYAFIIDTDVSLSAVRGEIKNPYEATQLVRKHSRDDSIEEPQKKQSVADLKKVLPLSCHFCFTNPDIEDHMIISIAQKSYVTIAKGPLSIPKGDMDFSGHCLLIPIGHISKLNGEEGDFFRNKTRQELLEYENSITRMNFEKFNMSTIVFEIHSAKTIHFHKQLIPISRFLSKNFSMALERQVYINNEKFDRNGKIEFLFFESPEDSEYKEIVSDPETNYMMFSIHETSEVPPQIYLGKFSANDRIDLQFGRRTLSFLMRLPNRTNWRSTVCLQTRQEEEAEVNKFQKAYRDYDIASN